MNVLRHFIPLVVASVAYASSCADHSDRGGDAGVANGGNSAGVVGEGGEATGTGGSRGGSSGTTGCGPCDDGFDCTVDACRAGSCVHTIGPNEGATACPSGEYCTLEEGCVRAPACATDADCEAAWTADPCKAFVWCDAASSLCLFNLLDKDSDGHAPHVCGGDDCNDDDDNVSPDQSERLDAIDNDCDGDVDNCQDHLCDRECVDLETTSWHCGACGIVCSNGAECVAGRCSCESVDPGVTLVTCPLPAGGMRCVDLATDSIDCGECGNSCTGKDSCVDGTCKRACEPYYGVDTCDPGEICIVWNASGSGPNGEGQWASCAPDPCPDTPLLRPGASGRNNCADCAMSVCPSGYQPCETLAINQVFCAR